VDWVEILSSLMMIREIVLLGGLTIMDSLALKLMKTQNRMAKLWKNCLKDSLYFKCSMLKVFMLV